MSGMAEVLADHYINYAAGKWKCTSLDCGFSTAFFDAAMGHVEAALAAAWFGPVKEAAATALEEAAKEMREERSTWCLDDAGRYWIRRTLDDLEDRSAAVRADQ